MEVKLWRLVGVGGMVFWWLVGWCFGGLVAGLVVGGLVGCGGLAAAMAAECLGLALEGKCGGRWVGGGG